MILSSHKKKKSAETYIFPREIDCNANNLRPPTYCSDQKNYENTEENEVLSPKSRFAQTQVDSPDYIEHSTSW